MIKAIIKGTLYFVIAIILILLGTFGYNFGRDVFSDEGYEEDPGTEVVVTIESGDTLTSVAKKLYNDGVIAKKSVYYVQSLIYEADYKPGTYTLNSSMDGETIIETLCTEIESGGDGE